ncbi:GIY-YIG nuclease family protein [Candidatus Dependentiae bacterium]
MKRFYVYILECNDGSYYTGHTENLEERLEQHVRGEINSYTASRKPLKLVYSEEFEERDHALQADTSSSSA